MSKTKLSHRLPSSLSAMREKMRRLNMKSRKTEKIWGRAFRMLLNALRSLTQTNKQTDRVYYEGGHERSVLIRENKLMMHSGAVGSESQTFARLAAGSFNSRVQLNTFMIQRLQDSRQSVINTKKKYGYGNFPKLLKWIKSPQLLLWATSE